MSGSDGRDSVRIKIKGTEFEAIGDKASVDDRFKAFMALAEKLVSSPDPDDHIVEEKGRGVEGQPKTNDTALEGLHKRAFRVDGEIVSLNALPQGNDQRLDTIILILYGRQQLVGESTTMIGSLLEGLTKTGLSIPRVARVIDGNASLVTKAGTKRGTRYGLTNQGTQRAEDVLRRMYS